GVNSAASSERPPMPASSTIASPPVRRACRTPARANRPAGDRKPPEGGASAATASSRASAREPSSASAKARPTTRRPSPLGRREVGDGLVQGDGQGGELRLGDGGAVPPDARPVRAEGGGRDGAHAPPGGGEEGRGVGGRRPLPLRPDDGQDGSVGREQAEDAR